MINILGNPTLPFLSRSEYFSITLRFPNWDPIEVSHLLRLFFAVYINLVEWARKPSYLELSLRISGSFTYSNNAGALKTLLAWDAELKW